MRVCAAAAAMRPVHRGDEVAISDALTRLHVSTSKDDASLRADMAYGMFDTRGKVRGRMGHSTAVCSAQCTLQYE